MAYLVRLMVELRVVFKHLLFLGVVKVRNQRIGLELCSPFLTRKEPMPMSVNCSPPYPAGQVVKGGWAVGAVHTWPSKPRH